jgi:DNA-binding NarL/FixJ family response regulator
MKAKIIIIDDEEEFLQSCAKNLTFAGHQCETFISADKGCERFSSNRYDLLICDVYVPFKDQREGGILLAQDFFDKHPTASIILISQFVNERWIKKLAGLGDHYVFVEKGNTLFEDLRKRIDEVMRAKKCFVCMPFGGEFDELYQQDIRPALSELHLACERADEIQHNQNILLMIREHIAAARLVIAVMTGRNPNVYYEVGYAHGIGKEVVLLTQKVEDIPTDLKGYNHLVYGSEKITLKSELQRRIEALFRAGTDI